MLDAANSTNQIKLPPPSGDSQRAEKYIDQLIPLISQAKLIVEHTDLSKYDPSSLHDHYRIDMQSYQLEISHSKQPLSGKDSYVLLFNNLKEIEKGYSQKVILAYLILTADQFRKLQEVADEQIETKKKLEQEKRFSQAMSEVDILLDKIAKGEIDVSKKAQPLPEISLPEEIAGQEKAEEQLSPQENEELIESSVSAVNTQPTAPPETAGPEEGAAMGEQNNIQIPPAQPAIAPPTVEEPTPSPATPSPSSTPTSSPPMPLEEIQKILQQASQNYQPPQIALGSTLPSIGSLPQAPAPVDQPIDTQPKPGSSAKIDEEIDKAFKPTDNSVLNNTHTPNV